MWTPYAKESNQGTKLSNWGSGVFIGMSNNEFKNLSVEKYVLIVQSKGLQVVPATWIL